LAHLLGTMLGADSSPSGVVVAADLTPAEAARLDPAQVLGILTAGGTAVSHAAILARSLGIPAVVGAGEGVLAVLDGTTILVDGTGGVFIVDPDATVSDGYRARAADQRLHAESLLARAARPATTSA